MLRKGARIFIILIVPLHVLAVLWVTIITIATGNREVTESKLYQNTRCVVEPYLTATGTNQQWRLFTSAPYFHDYQVEIEVVDTAGKLHQFAPILPGLKPFDPFDNIRHLSIFQRFGGDYHSYTNSYMQRAISEIEARGVVVQEAYLNIYERRTRFVENIQQDHIVYTEHYPTFGPYLPKPE